MSKRGRQLWLLVGIAILMILGAISVTRYQAMSLQSREEVLKTNLAAVRETIKQYVKDKQRAPMSLQELVTAGYFRELPFDPMTNSNSTWQPVIEDVVISPGQTSRDITDLRSGSAWTGSNGTAYNAW